MTPTITSEKVFLKHVKAEAKKRGWTFFHETYSLGSDKGFPDVFICHDDHGSRFVELKYGKNKLGPDQERWRDALQRAGQKWYLFYPADWDKIIRLLDGEDVTIGNSDTPQLELPV